VNAKASTPLLTQALHTHADAIQRGGVRVSSRPLQRTMLQIGGGVIFALVGLIATQL
jgi:hypothetical protein